MAPTNTSPNPLPERLAFSPREAAEALGVSRETIYRLLARGKLRASPFLRHKLIPKAELQRFLASL
jgi:excisionase family DNA binding protein